MNLFRCPDAQKEKVDNPARFQTPLGSVRLEALLDGKNAANETAAETYTLPAGGWIACWRKDAFDLELLACRPEFVLPPGMRVMDCWAGLWRLKARRPDCFLCIYRRIGNGLHMGRWRATYRRRFVRQNLGKSPDDNFHWNGRRRFS